MSMMYKNALVSVSDKTGLVEFLKPLAEQGLRVLSTGGTAKHLEENGVPVIQVSEQTGFPEVMDGRVRTLHPKIHMALLARDHKPDDLTLLKENEIEPFDLVIGNLYPFEQSLSRGLNETDQSEMIDIGGPCLLRAAAKNYDRITVICDPNDYESLQKGTDVGRRKELASKVFHHTASYDALIANHLSESKEGENEPSRFSLSGEFINELRYGENPHQKASWYRTRGQQGLQDAEILQGKALSFNNLLDLEAAVSTVKLFGEENCAVAVKHTNPCGVALDRDVAEATRKALKADPVSVFGGIVAMNYTVNADVANQLVELFLECVIAPEVDTEAKEILARKKNLRVLTWDGMKPDFSIKRGMKIKTVGGGYLVQEEDQVKSWDDSWKVIGQTPNAEIKQTVSMIWRVCAQLKSNAIAIADKSQTLGLGMGQVNRVDAVDQAVLRMKKHHEVSETAVLASDAFFPFPDSIDLIHEAGIRWVIQPGGSIKDADVIARAEELGINMILTGQRHFSH